MNENVRKVFDMLGVEPNEEFEVMLKNNSKFSYKFKFDENLQGYCFRDKLRLEEDLLRILLSETYEIIKPQKTKKLRDLTPEVFDKWKEKNCNFDTECQKCVFKKVICYNSRNKYSWVNNKDIYSEKFLNQEIEVEE